MNSIADIVAALGGPSNIAKALEASPRLVTDWRRNGSIPVRYWPALQAAAEDHGVSLSYEQLVAIHSQPNSEVAA
jgi:predicted SpoU family rRNA methylase